MRGIDFDVIVAGGGPGGGSAALHLVHKGLRVLVVERARLPRYKPCGGAIPRTTLDCLPFPHEAIVRSVPEAVRFTFPGQAPVDAALPDRPVAMVMRSEFDAWLLNQAGAEVLDGAAVTGVEEMPAAVRIRAGERCLTARYLVAADGATSGLARRLGLRSRRRFGGTLEAEVLLAGKPALGERYGHSAVFALGAVPWGYAWVFPKGDCLSVGVGSFRPRRVDLHAALHATMTALGVPLEGVTVHGHAIPCYRPRPWPLRLGQPLGRLHTRRCVLVGDAAGLVDPLLGEGIRYALAGGRLVAEAIAQDNLSGYERSCWREMGRSLATAGRAARVLYSFPQRSFRLGVRNPAALRLFVALLSGRTGYVGIGPRLATATAAWVWQGRAAARS